MSLYNDPVFAAYWNKRNGNDGEPYKYYVLDPLMFSLIGSLKNKTILELGCGNGYLAKRFLKGDPKRVILTDISEYNLKHAKEKCSDPRVQFLQQDATKLWNVEAEFLEGIYSNMVLNELAEIEIPIKEAYRTLKKGGFFIFSITHPAWDLFIYAQEQIGKRSEKIKGLKGYFHRGYAQFIMGVDSEQREFAVEHYQRPLSDYFYYLLQQQFTLRQFLEPTVTPQLIQAHPRFKKYKDVPISIIFYCKKD